ncbi:MAG: squalene--hopene cyclase [Elusimicrobia bacterium]|nr:squalene--hopene cyclase [Elusimicrobiota bacterium]
MKLAGYAPEAEPLQRARACIEGLGGIHQVNSYSKLYMALFGLYDWKGVPAIPPELMVFPSWFYFNIYEMSAWTRGIVIPLSIVWAMKPRCEPPPHGRLDELFPEGQPHWVPVVGHPTPGERLFSWRRFFLWWDRGLKWLEGKGPHWVRVKALQRAEAWMRQRFEHSGGLGAIFPPMVNAVLAMKALGYSDDHPWVRHHMEELARFELDHGETLEIQPCFSPVWDTALSSLALAESGLPPDHPALVRAARWLIQKEIRIPGDWQVKNATGPVGGWFFEFENAFYPDTDDTAMVLLALRRIYLEGSLAQEREKAYLRGLNWLLSMQSADGGWGAFDINNTKAIFEKIPFADHNAMIDPPTADITGRVLELLGQVGYDRSYRPVQRAIEFLKREQEADGSWYGRWGVNYLYGTWQVLRGLTSVGEDVRDATIQQALQWFRSVQRPDGGWGETCATYDDPKEKGQGPSTPSQTAWALMAFLTCGVVNDPSVERGLQYLLSTQRPDGSWDEEEFTGTGFPKVFYLGYTYYRHYFPLLALGMYRRQRQRLHRERRAVAHGMHGMQ